MQWRGCSVPNHPEQQADPLQEILQRRCTTPSGVDPVREDSPLFHHQPATASNRQTVSKTIFENAPRQARNEQARSAEALNPNEVAVVAGWRGDIARPAFHRGKAEAAEK